MLNLSGHEILSIPHEPFGRRQYLRTGLALMALKYVVDAVVIYGVTGILWTPLDYVLSLASMSGAKAAGFPAGLNILLLLWTLPFLWAGVVLSVRRAKDAGLPVWIVVAFFIPVANYALMVLLASWPRAAIVVLDPSPPLEDAGDDQSSRMRGRLAGVAAGLVTGLAMVGIGTFAFRTYSFAMFLVTPFMIGLASAYTARRFDRHSDTPSAVVLCTLGALAGAIVLLAFEGIGCLIMAAPIGVPLALLGGVIGHHIAAEHGIHGSVALVLVLFPAGQAADRVAGVQPLREVMSSIEIDAPPQQVWSNVVSFSEITQAPAWYFRAGLSYPLRARIVGSGPGAVRYCEFTTGAFREPITVWNEPSLLAFDVAGQPPPLQEWSPYRNVYAPHLKGFFTTTKGEFRLIHLPGGRTRLEGRTWYSLRMRPLAYWTVFADAIVHRIHLRVLDHIKKEAEKTRLT